MFADCCKVDAWLVSGLGWIQRKIRKKVNMAWEMYILSANQSEYGCMVVYFFMQSGEKIIKGHSG